MEQNKLQQYIGKEVVFDKYWFKKNQRILLWFVNTFLGKYFFRFKKMGHNITNQIVKITPFSIAELISIKDDKVELREHFFSKNEYAKKLYWYLLPVWYAMHFWDYLVIDHFRLAPQLNFGFSTLTKNPVAGANSPCDGYVLDYGNNMVWASLIAEAGNYFDVAASTGYAFAAFATTTSNQWERLGKSIFLFDTSSLTASATISDAVLSLYGFSKGDESSNTPNLDIYAATPANTNTLANGDFTQVGAVSQTGSPITYANFSTAGYNDFTFDATGRGNISKTGISKFGARNANYDVAATAPTWGSNKTMLINVYFADNASNKPKLVITYTVPSTTHFLSTLGVGV